MVGLWLTWVDVLPALNALNDIALWNTTQTRDGETLVLPVTLVDVLMGLLFATVAYISAKNLPGALELAVLNRTTMDTGAKYAFNTILRYIFLGAGVTFLLGSLGMEWSKLQWLVAALSVGLGFGLQEIVANFISGLILLFERPIRVGDVVTVNNSTGTVTRIQIRATTLLDLEKKELIVPNKFFITSEVLNWTLSDQTNRVLINVGVAYGANTRLAMELMQQAAEEHPNVLSEPAPIATFEGFGDNALNLVLRCYLGAMVGRLKVISELHESINERLAHAEISIAFPQRDLHVDFSGPIDVNLSRPGVRRGRSGRGR